MSRHRLPHPLLALLGGACLIGTALPATADPAAALRLRWSVDRHEITPAAPMGHSQASLSLTTGAALPAQGWSIYFNSVADVAADSVEGPFRIERLNGGLYRLRPTAGFAGLAAGETLRVRFFHPEILTKPDKGPTGPYLVLDSAPGQGWAIADYQRQPPATGGPAPRLGAEAIYRRNETIAEVPEGDLPPVFPPPARHARGTGSLHWQGMPAIIAAPALAREAAQARQLLARRLPARPLPGPAAGAPALHLALGQLPGQVSAEAYRLVIDPRQGVVITGQSPAGVAHGLQSLRQLLAAAGAGVALPALTIEDAPRFAHRGLMLDVARNFQPKETVFRWLDLMARYKLNTLHLHLTDDEGWRLAIPGLPELTRVGGRRGHGLDERDHLAPAHGSGPGTDDPHGSGHYSAGDYLEILRYAAARHIEVIPEIEMPGHARAAVKAMASRHQRLAASRPGEARRYLLADPADASRYQSAQLYTDNVMDPGLPSTYAFIERVVGEVAALHRRAGVPLRTLHVGGDELPAGAWAGSPASRALMAQHRLASVADLWDHFYTRVERILARHGLKASGWEELGVRKVQEEGKEVAAANPRFLGRGFQLYVWNNLAGNADLAYRLANAGYDTVLAPATRLYFDMAHNGNPEEPGVNWAAYADLDQVFDLVPEDMLRPGPTEPARPGDGLALSTQGRGHLIGLEGTLFSETVRDPARMDFLLLPRLLALAERAWSPDPEWARESDPGRAALLHRADWSRFVHQLGHRVLPALDADGIGYRIPPPGLSIVAGQVRVNHQLPGFTLRYSADGSEPGPASPVVDGPIREPGVIRVAAFGRDGRRGMVSQIENRPGR